MKDILLDNLGVTKAAQTKEELLIEELFNEDQDYKLKLATQYDMLSYVGSDIDEVKMDHLTFFKLYNKHWGANYDGNKEDLLENLELNNVLEHDSQKDALLEDIDTGLDGISFLGMSLPISSNNQLKGLAFFH